MGVRGTPGFMGRTRSTCEKDGGERKLSGSVSWKPMKEEALLRRKALAIVSHATEGPSRNNAKMDLAVNHWAEGMGFGLR